jgi:hypothetical protein
MHDIHQLELFDLRNYQSDQIDRDLANVAWIREKLHKIEYEQFELDLSWEVLHKEDVSEELNQVA